MLPDPGGLPSRKGEGVSDPRFAGGDVGGAPPDPGIPADKGGGIADFGGGRGTPREPGGKTITKGKRNLLLAAAGVGVWLAGRALVRSLRAYDLRGKRVLITGGSRGLGLVLAREFGRHGCDLAICARDTGELHRAQDDLSGYAGRVLAVQCDLTDRDQVRWMIDTVQGRFGRIDVLVNNAGTIQVGPMEVMTEADYESAMRTHFWAPLYTTLAVLPGMRQRGEGRIVNISSIGGKVSIPHLLLYSASKFALTGFSEGLRAELLKDGIYVTTVCPGLMRTGSPPNADFKGQHRLEYAWFAISDSVPGASTSAEHAARRIVRACRYGDAELLITLPAQLAVLFHGVFPGLTSDLMGLTNRLLPAPGGIGTASAKGRDSESDVTRSGLTALTDAAARRNNELAPEGTGAAQRAGQGG
jgi:short-subunit dehydrogenase